MIIISKNCLFKGCPQRGQDHKWDFDRPTGREILRIQKILGDYDKWAEAIDGDNGVDTETAINAIFLLVDILHRRDDIVVPWDNVDVDLLGDGFGMFADPDLTGGAEDAEGKDPAPTPASRPRKPRQSSTSGQSAAAASKRRSSSTPKTSGAGTD